VNRNALRRMRALVGPFVLLCATWWSCGHALAERDDEPTYARVVIETTAVRTGPGASFRLIRAARRDELFVVQARAPRGYWLRVQLPDGTSGFVQGDAVYVETVSHGDQATGVWGRIFAPPPLATAHGEISLSLGALSQAGFMAVRPVWMLAPSFGLEANLGASVGASGRLFLGGLGGLVNLFPSFPLVPFLAAGGGGVYAAPNADSFIFDSGTRSMIYAGGGLRFGFRHRIVLRVEGRAYALFNASGLVAQQEISGGLSAFF